MKDRKLEELARNLWSKHANALAYLAERRPGGLRDIFAELSEDLPAIAAEISDGSHKFVAEKSTQSILRFAYHAWDSLPGFCKGKDWIPSNRFVLFELKFSGQQATSEVYLGPGDRGIRDKILNEVKNHRHRKDMPPGQDWMCLSKVVLSNSDDGSSTDGESRDQIIEKFSTFCRAQAHQLSPLLQKALKPPPSTA